MAQRTRLSDLDDWQLVHDEQDIRGWKALDKAGQRLGIISDLLVNTDTKLVESIRLDNGQEYDIRLVDIGDGVVYIHAQTADTDPVVSRYDDVVIRRQYGDIATPET